MFRFVFMGIFHLYICFWLVVSTPLKNMSSSVGIMTFPISGKIQKCSEPPTRFINGDISYIYIPIGSMYGIYANIGGILMVNVTIYTIHGIYI